MKVLVNLSNHPLCKWSEKQIAAAEVYGECRDMPFPAVPSEIGGSEVRKLADVYVDKLKTLGERYEVTVHIMGEMSVTHCIVSRLLRMGITCVCSTSERIVKEGANGEKTVKFDFKRFREYVE